jgi:hypothetical protein
MRDLLHAFKSGEKSRLTSFPHLEVAHRMVPDVQEVPEGTGEQKINFELRTIQQPLINSWNQRQVSITHCHYVKAII